jgi:hypothetical protein
MRIGSHSPLPASDARTSRSADAGSASDPAGSAATEAPRHAPQTDTFEVASLPTTLFGRPSVDLGLAPGADPRGALGGPGLEREAVFDPAAGVPEGMSLEQSLPAGLDGGALRPGPNHHGVGSFDRKLDGRVGGDAVAGVTRDVLPGAPAGNGSQAPGSRPAVQDKPPAGADLNFRAPNHGLISADGGPSAWQTVKSWFTLGSTDTPDGGTPAPPVRPPGDTPIEKPKAEPYKPYKAPGHDAWMQKKPKMTNPDADAGSVGTATPEQIERALAAKGGDTRQVQGHGAGPQVDNPEVKRSQRDLVTDSNADVEVVTVAGTPTAPPPVDEVSKPVHPGAGLGPELKPNVGPVPNGGDVT